MVIGVESRERKIDAFFERVKRSNLDEETTSDLSKFAVVMICGYIERSVELVIVERISKRAQPAVVSFVKSYFKRGTNYDCEPIRQLLERFDKKWAEKFEEFLSKNGSVRESIGSAYTLRNSIAHGGEASRGLQGVLAIFVDAKCLVKALIDSTK
jgi:RiboL-PSP-HEPN